MHESKISGLETNRVEFLNSVEGPRPTERVVIPTQEFLLISPEKRADWLYKHILERLENPLLSQVISSVIEEKTVRANQPNKQIGWGMSLTPRIRDYAFRAFQRRSDGNALPTNQKATYNDAEKSIHQTGIEADGESFPAYTMISPANVLDYYFLPAPHDLEAGLIDLSVLLVYENRVFCLPQETASMVEVVNLSIPTASERAYSAPAAEVKSLQLPTLRDIYLGKIEVLWQLHRNKKIIQRIQQLFTGHL